MPHPPSSNSGTGSVHGIGPILIVDDDPAFASMLTETLGTWNLPNQIITLMGGQKLVEQMGRLTGVEFGAANYPSLIILDLKMPGMGGIEVLQWLKKCGHTEVPVIIVTGSQDFPSIAQTYELGAYCYISKPQRPGDLDKIKHALRIWT
ncbi:MAG: response regulator receiver protein [Verrucomicrobiales bacterium]|nr:response regulator receiver protein [Verrucomicrobiales bacterium]